MSENDDIRRVLEELSSHPPQRDRKPAVHERIAVVRRRRQMAGGVTLSVVTLLSAIAVASLPAGQGLPDESTLNRSESRTPAPPPSPSAPSGSATPQPTDTDISTAVPGSKNPVPARKSRTISGPVMAASSPAARTAPAQSPLHVESSASTDSDPATRTTPPAQVSTAPRTPPSSVLESASPSGVPGATGSSSSNAKLTTSASATVPASPSASVSASAMSPTTPDDVLDADISVVTAAEGSAPESTVTVRVHGSISGSLDTVTVWYTKLHRTGYTDAEARACTPRDGKLHDVDETFTFRTRYRAAGETQVDVTVSTLDEQCSPRVSERLWPFSQSVVIPVGSLLSNGPKPVALSIGAQVEGQRIVINASASDPDGYVSSFLVNWGTGTPEVFPGGNGANCGASEAGGVFWPDLNGSGRFTSPALPPGTHTVTITATSTGCDGRNAQTNQQSVVVTLP